MVACSGGADSTALLIALALATRELVVAHVIHDLRPRLEAEADRDAVRSLAGRLGLPFVEGAVRVMSLPGNKEGLARRERYAVLARLAFEHRCPFVATAHHADDQLETMLMALVRGAGPHGLRGIAPVRTLRDPAAADATATITLIRPMLGCTRADARAACTSAGIAWREDATNADASRRRAALRHQVLPMLAALAPGGPRRAAHAADLLRDAACLIDQRVVCVFGEAVSWARSTLRSETPLVLGAGLRRAILRATRGAHADAINSRTLRSAVRAIRDASTEPRDFAWAGGVHLRVTSSLVTLLTRE